MGASIAELTGLSADQLMGLAADDFAKLQDLVRIAKDKRASEFQSRVTSDEKGRAHVGAEVLEKTTGQPRIILTKTGYLAVKKAWGDLKKFFGE